MPCDTIQTAQVNFKLNVTDLHLLKKALEALGYFVTLKDDVLSFSKAGYSPIRGTFTKGEFSASIRGDETKLNINEIKRAYSTEVVEYASKRFGWNIKQSADNKFEVQRKF